MDIAKLTQTWKSKSNAECRREMINDEVNIECFSIPTQTKSDDN